MTYSPETQRLIEAVTAGHVCADCGAPNYQRHFDDCPKHPENGGES